MYCLAEFLNAWNSLPNHMVLTPSLNLFKSRLDIHWHGYPFCEQHAISRASEYQHLGLDIKMSRWKAV